MKTSPRWRIIRYPFLPVLVGVLTAMVVFGDFAPVQARGPSDTQRNFSASRGNSSGSSRNNMQSGPAFSAGPQRQSTFRQSSPSASPRISPSFSSSRSEPMVRSAPQRMNYGTSGSRQGGANFFRTDNAAPAGDFGGRATTQGTDRSAGVRSSWAPIASARTDAGGRSASSANGSSPITSAPIRFGGGQNSSNDVRNQPITRFQNGAATTATTTRRNDLPSNLPLLKNPGGANASSGKSYGSPFLPGDALRGAQGGKSSFPANGANSLPKGDGPFRSGFTQKNSFDPDTNRLQQRFRTQNPSVLTAPGGKSGTVPFGNTQKIGTLQDKQNAAKFGVKNSGGAARFLPGGALDAKTLKTPSRDLGKSGGPRLDSHFGDAGKAGGMRLPNSSLGKGDNLKQIRGSLQSDRFPQRLKSGEFEALNKGAVAKKINLADQYKHHAQGDVARRLDLQKNVHHLADAHPGGHPHPAPAQLYVHKPAYYHGWVHPHYINSCFRFNYFGPGFFAGFAWYPHWNPWVAWSWHYHCHPLWDPRPWWCRPIFYDPCPVWVYWEVPVWRPLPVVVCGTWVDVPEAPVAVPEQFDLQLLAVRFVDPGHPDEKLGPRYRVWFRNNSAVPITTPFDVMVLAGNDNQLKANLPGQGVRVQAINPGDVQSVDIRLPFEVGTMNRDAAGQPAPFSVLHVLVDANRAVNDVVQVNNGVSVRREEVLPVDPAVFEAEPAPNGANGEMLVAGEGLGPLPGQALIHVAGKEYEAEITGWYDLGARLNLPPIPVAQPATGELILVRGDGAAANPMKIRIQPQVVPPQGAPLPEPPPAPGGPELEKPRTF
jgi:hypothetical protein